MGEVWTGSLDVSKIDSFMEGLTGKRCEGNGIIPILIVKVE